MSFFDLLPDELLERIFLAASTGNKAQHEDAQSWELTCKRWQRIAEPLTWANRVLHFPASPSRTPNYFGRLIQPRLAPFFNAVGLSAVADAWLWGPFSTIAPFLVSLDIELRDQPGAGLRNVRACTNLERLGVKCSTDKRGNLADILDTVSHLPLLTQLALQHFEAMSHPLAPLLFASTLSNLFLHDISGEKASSLLYRAFPFSRLPNLRLLHLTQVPFEAVIRLLGSHRNNLVHATVDLIDVYTDNVNEFFLNSPPFPALKSLSADFSDASANLWLYCVQIFGLALTTRRHLFPALEKVGLAKEPSWPGEVWTEAVETRIEAIKGIRGTHYFPGADLDLIISVLDSPSEGPTVSNKVKNLVSLAFIASPFRGKVARPSKLEASFPSFHVEEVLRKGAALRRKREEGGETA